MKLIKSCKAIIHALAWQTEELVTASKRVAQLAVAIDKEINLGKQFPVSIDVVDERKSSSTTLKN